MRQPDSPFQPLSLSYGTGSNPPSLNQTHTTTLSIQRSTPPNTPDSCCKLKQECCINTSIILAIVFVLVLCCTAIYLAENLPCHIDTNLGDEGSDSITRFTCSDNTTIPSETGIEFTIGGDCKNYTCDSMKTPATCEVELANGCVVNVKVNTSTLSAPNVFLLMLGAATTYAQPVLDTISSLTETLTKNLTGMFHSTQNKQTNPNRIQSSQDKDTVHSTPSQS